MGNCLLIFYKRDLENQDKDHVWPSIEGFYWLGTNSGLIKSWKSSQAKGLSCQWLKIIPPKSTGDLLTWLKMKKNWMSLWDAGPAACWWLWLAEIIDPVSLCWHISRAAWKKRSKKDAKRDERSWLRKESQTNQVPRQLCEKTKNFSNVVASSNFTRLDSGPREPPGFRSPNLVLARMCFQSCRTGQQNEASTCFNP